jgi:hypothetical protein
MGAGIMLVLGFFVVVIGVIAANVLPDEWKKRIIEKVNKI